ncbi:hypothetical protein [Chryseobacterium sp. POE27]|uniref:hypothetical protein n=1 Tax=Chryseobacterium sp. POE27 TaxID=3138177 RepID=UPI00321A9DAA
MDIQTRKLNFIQDFLKLQSEEAIAQFEKLMKNTKSVDPKNNPQPFTVDELNERISKSEEDFKNKKFKTTTELLSKYNGI